MTLLDFARGPAMQWAVAIFVIGCVWRVIGTFLMRRRRDLSKPRRSDAAWGGLRTVAIRSVPPHDLEKNITFQHITGYLWHIGYFVTVLLFIPHITFFDSILGFAWPGLPNNIVLITAAITLAVLAALLIRRAMHPVLRLISTADDWISVVVTILPLITGFMAYAHLGPRYEDMLAIHLLSVEALLVWFPFGKLVHLFFSLPARYQAGAEYQRRGVRA